MYAHVTSFVQEDLEVIKTCNLSIMRFKISRNLIIYLKMQFQIEFIEERAYKKVFWTESKMKRSETGINL